MFLVFVGIQTENHRSYCVLIDAKVIMFVIFTQSEVVLFQGSLTSTAVDNTSSCWLYLISYLCLCGSLFV